MSLPVPDPPRDPGLAPLQGGIGQIGEDSAPHHESPYPIWDTTSQENGLRSGPAFVATLVEGCRVGRPRYRRRWRPCGGGREFLGNRGADIPVGVRPAGKPALRASWTQGAAGGWMWRLFMDRLVLRPLRGRRKVHSPKRLSPARCGDLLASSPRSRTLPWIGSWCQRASNSWRSSLPMSLVAADVSRRTCPSPRDGRDSVGHGFVRRTHVVTVQLLVVSEVEPAIQNDGVRPCIVLTVRGNPHSSADDEIVRRGLE